MFKTMHEADQRRPSRISTISNDSKQTKICTTTPTTRLKSSSIAKVPLANSRLRQPVEPPKKSIGTNVTAAGRPTSLPLGNCATKRTCTSLLPTSKTMTGSTLPLSAQNRSSSAKTTALLANKRTSAAAAATKEGPAPSSDGCKRAGGLLKNLVAVVHPQHSSQQRVSSSATTTTTTTTNKPTSSSTTQHSQAPVKTNSANSSKLMSCSAVLRAAESGKVNFNHKDVNGRETGNTALPVDGTTTGKQENGSKLAASLSSLKSQSQQILFGSQKTTTTLAPVTIRGHQVESSGCLRRKVSARVVSSSSATRRTTTTSKNGRSSSLERDDLNSTNSSSAGSSSSGSPSNDDDDRQFSLCNGNNENRQPSTRAATLSVASRNFSSDESRDKEDARCSKQQHGKSKQQTIKKHPLGRTYFNSPSSAASKLSTADQQQQPALDGSDRQLRDNCYSNNYHRSAKSTLSKLPPPSLAQAAKAINDCSDDLNRLPAANGHGRANGALNQRLLSKPMGQQVLSLMMLDVGLLPSGLSNSNSQLSQAQQSSDLHNIPSVSHVRIQSPPEGSFDVLSSSDTTSRVRNRCLLQTLQPFNQSDNNINTANLGFAEQRSNLPIDEMLRLRLNSLNNHLDNQRAKSISLPSSPRLISRQQHRQQTTPHPCSRQIERLSRISSSLISDRTTTNRLLGPSSIYHQGSEHNAPLQQQRHQDQQTTLTADRRCVEDSRSISSSCSSLNHYYPPLLAISNQLNELNLQELMLQRRAELTQDESKHKQLPLMSKAAAIGQTNSSNDSVTVIPTVVADRTSTKTGHKSSCPESGTITESGRNTSSSSNINGPEHNCDDGISSNGSNCFNACSQQSKPSDTDSGYENIGDHSPGPAELIIQSPPIRYHLHRYQHDHLQNQQTTAAPSIGGYRDGESCPDPSLRQRQQQQRSHSISGQELNFNGTGYQRLNQFITQHVSPEVDHHRQRYGMQTPTNVYQSTQPQPQQQQQHLRTQLSGRSPSPLSYAGHIDQNHDISLSKYQNNSDIQKPRNLLHASLECLNSGYMDYQHHHQNQHHHQQQLQHQQQQQQQHQQQHQQMRQHQMSLQSQHYAPANYVHGNQAANSAVNQGEDQDLAAAAIDNHVLASQHHPQYQLQHQSGAVTPTPNNIYAHQSIINRAMAQVHQSPARRFSSAQHGSTGVASNLINNFTNLHHPIRAGHSSLSLSSSSYIIEDKLQNEIRKLHSELKSEKEKNEALNSQLNINSNLMAAFEQSLTTLNSRLRQLTTINEKKDQEIEELRVQISLSKLQVDDVSNQAGDNSPAPSDTQNLLSPDDAKTPSSSSEKNRSTPMDEREDLMKVIEDLKKQLIDKDRLLTDTRLEALSAAHQLEQLESRLDRDHRSIVVNEDDLDEGVMVVNHSPSDASDAVTDSALFSEINTSQLGGGKGSTYTTGGDTQSVARTPYDHHPSSNAINKSSLDSSPECNNNNISAGLTLDNQSSHSSDYHDNSSTNELLRVQTATNDQQHQQQQLQQTSCNLSESDSQHFKQNAVNDTSPMDRLMDSLLSSSAAS